MPASGAGLIRYFDEEGRGIKIQPKHMLFFIVGFIVFEIALRFGLGRAILGF
jgi:preprotein translocase subunit Sec61beta